MEESIDPADATPSPQDLGDLSLLSQLPPPPPIAVQVYHLSIQAPVPQWVIPLALPIRVPRWVQRRLQRRSEVVPKELVRGVGLRAQPGEVLAIIGGSGSGKTTLLNAIAGRAADLELSSGSINYSSPSLSPRQARKTLGFVRQTDDLLPHLTVRETLTFAAALRLPRTVSTPTRNAIVEQTLEELGLRDVADVTIGGGLAKKGISGGERRRLSIGCVLVTLPSVLLLDEPTTGLDAFTSFQLLRTLKRLAQRGRTIILSIHQPRSDLFPVFNSVCLLSRGDVVYSGTRAGMLPHFSKLGYDSPQHTNPLDFAIDISSVDSRSDEAEAETGRRVGKLIAAWKGQPEKTGSNARAAEEASRDEAGEARASPVEEEKGFREATSAGDQRTPSPSAGDQRTPSPADHDVEQGLSAAPTKREEVEQEEDGATKRATFLQQTLLLSRRGSINVMRNRAQLMGFFLQAVIIGVVQGLVFLNPPETPSGIQSLKTVIYFGSGPAMFYLSIIVAVFILCETELVIFDREREDQLYSTVPWVLALFTAYLPANVIFPTLYAIISYFMTGFRRDSVAKNLLSFIAQCIMQQQASWGYALFAASINRSFAQASLLANGFSIPFYLSAGYLITSLPGYIAWIRYLSPYFYGFNWISRLQFADRTFACTGVTGSALNQCDGQQVLVGLKLHLSTPLWVFPIGLLAFGIVTYTLATVLLAFSHPGGVKHATALEAAERARPEVVVMDKEKRNPTRVDLVVQDLHLTVRKKSPWKSSAQEKMILEGVDARFPAGEVSAIMGPSGSGKSSLLQLLGGRIKSGAFSAFKSSGAILLNDSPLNPQAAASTVAFVEQEDAYHLPALTVRETLQYAARLRLRGRSSAECDARAEEVLRMLGLRVCADNLVGGELVKGISGGEKRRLSLAVELLSDPPVLLLDEPLSGLDAFTAQSVMQELKNLAATGRTVILSIHQPRSELWSMFNNVHLLVKGGRCAYSGPTPGILGAFEAVGETCPKNFNPADFVLDTVSVDYSSPAAEERSYERISKVVEAQRAPSALKTAQTNLPAIDVADSKRPAPFLQALPTVLGRSFRNLRRQPDIFFARLLNPPFLALLFWLFFLRLGCGPSTAQDRVGLIQETTALPFVGMLGCISIFFFEKNLFFHEWRTSARHSAATFILAYTLQETAVSLVSSLLWSLIFTFGMNLQHSARIFIEFWISSFALISCGESIGIVFSSFTNSGGLAISLVSAGLTLLAQLNGIISVSLDFYLEVIGWISPMKPQSYVTIINEMRGLRFDCSEADVASGACPYSTGEEVLDTFGLPHGDTGKFLGILLALVVLWRLAAFGALRLRVVYL